MNMLSMIVAPFLPKSVDRLVADIEKKAAALFNLAEKNLQSADTIVIAADDALDLAHDAYDEALGKADLMRDEANRAERVAMNLSNLLS